MKKTFTLILTLTLCLQGFSQHKTTKSLEPFTKLKVYDRISVTLVKSNENKLVISGDDQDEVSISNKKGVLKIRMEFANFLDGNQAIATLYYNGALELVDANENAKIFSKKTIEEKRLEIKAQEGGKIDIKINTPEVYTKSVTGGEITLSGTAKTQEVMVNTGGKIYNRSLSTKYTDVVVNAGGRAEVKATEEVIAKVRAGGSIYIYGNPKEIDRDKMFGGKIKVMP